MGAPTPPAPEPERTYKSDPAWDKLLIGVPALISGVIVIATKLLASLGLLLVLFGVWTGASHAEVTITPTKLLTIGAGLIAFGGYLVRQVTKFKNRQIRKPLMLPSANFSKA